MTKKIADTAAADTNFGPTELVPLALEPRIAFDAAAGAELVDQISDGVVDSADVEAVDTAQEALTEALSAPLAEGANQVVFIDAGVEDPADLIAAVPSGAEVHFLSADQDGVVQIAALLEGRSGLDAIHILSHGQAGSLTLGSVVLDSSSIGSTHVEALESIGAALSDAGDILVYGCDFGADASLLEALSAATGADVAASDDATGVAERGATGNWKCPLARLKRRPLWPLTGTAP